MQRKKGSTDVTFDVFILDSSQTDGRGLAGLAYDTASIACYYRHPVLAEVAVSLATQTVNGAHSDGGFVEIDSTNMPGVYRLDLPDAAYSGYDSVTIMLHGATNMGPVVKEIQLTDWDPNVEYATLADLIGYTMSENSALPDKENPLLGELLMFNYSAVRNKRYSSATEDKVYKGDGTVLGTATITYAAGELTLGAYA